MNIAQVRELCELAMADPNFREQFITNPNQAAEDRGLHLAPEEIAQVLCLSEDDCVKPRDVSKDFTEEVDCLPTAGLGCEPRKVSQPAGPRC